MEKHEVVIVGAGPGGLKAAQTLAKHGKKDILVLEQLQERKIGEKICHCLLLPHTMSILNIPKELTDLSINGAIVYFSDKSYTKIDLNPPICQMWLRRNFGRWLAEETRKLGVEIRSDSKVININKNEKNVELKNGEKIGYNYLIGADGSNSVVRKSLELKSKAVISALIEVDIPPDKIPNGRADFGRLYISFDIHAHGASGFAPYKDRISFAFLSIDTEFLSNSEKIKNFNRFVKEVEGIDVKKYELKVQTAFYKPIGLKHGSVYLIGDAGGFSTFLAEGIYAAAKTGKLAAEDICGIDISRENKEFMKWKRRWDFPINLINRYNRVLPKKIRKKISGFIIDILIPKLAKNGFFMSTIFPFAYPKVLRMGWGPLRGDKE